MGLAQSNVVKLEWSQIDLERQAAWIHPNQAKARKAIHVPLNSVALAVLLRQVGNTPCQGVYVSRPAHHMGEHARMEGRADTGRHRGF